MTSQTLSLPGLAIDRSSPRVNEPSRLEQIVLRQLDHRIWDGCFAVAIATIAATLVFGLIG